jgi:hypothetical protein
MWYAIDCDAISELASPRTVPITFGITIWPPGEHLDIKLIRQTFAEFSQQLPRSFDIRPIGTIDE